MGAMGGGGRNRNDSDMDRLWEALGSLKEREQSIADAIAECVSRAQADLLGNSSAMLRESEALLALSLTRSVLTTSSHVTRQAEQQLAALAALPAPPAPFAPQRHPPRRR